MAFKRSAVRSRLSPPRNTTTRVVVFFLYHFAKTGEKITAADQIVRDGYAYAKKYPPTFTGGYLFECTYKWLFAWAQMASNVFSLMSCSILHASVSAVSASMPSAIRKRVSV